jgi:hypothetical protein
MEIQNEGLENSTYSELLDSFSILVRNPKDAYGILWFNIYELINQSEICEKKDCLGDLMNLLSNNNKCTDIYGAFQNNTEWYQTIKRNYCFGKTIEELGEYWQELMREQKPFRLRILSEGLRSYHDVIMPYVYERITHWEQIENLPVRSIQRKKEYRDYKKTVEETIKLVHTVREMID